MHPSKPSYFTHASHADAGHIFHAKTPRQSTSLRGLVNHLWQVFLDWAAACPEPKITQRFDRQGQRVGWQVFDPHTGRTSSFGSELEVRQWLEERYR